MNFLFDLFARALNFFYEIYPSYGFAIVGLTLIVMAVLTPLTLKGTRSMMMMQQLQPELKKLQSKYKDDIQKRNEEMMKFYKENNINPVGGCLPLLVQMPVFLVLYNVLRGLTQRIPNMGSNVGWVTGQSGSGSGLSKPPIVHNLFQPEHLAKDSEMYLDLSQTNTMPFTDFFPFDLSESASEAFGRGIGHSLPYVILIVVVGITGFVQQKQIQGRMQVKDMSDQQRQQQQIMKIMPIFLPVISFGLPSGLVVYFAVSNLYRVGQQWFISRSIYGIKKGEGPAATAGGGAKGAGGKGGGGKGPAGPKGAGPKGAGSKIAGGGSRRGSGPTDDDADGDDGVDEEATSVATKRAGKTPAKAGARTAGTKTTPVKTTPAKKTVPARGKTGVAASTSSDAKPARSGNSRTTPSKAAARATTKATTTARADKAASGSKSTAGKPARDDTDRPPTLQPRARKTKKR